MEIDPWLFLRIGRNTFVDTTEHLPVSSKIYTVDGKIQINFLSLTRSRKKDCGCKKIQKKINP